MGAGGMRRPCAVIVVLALLAGMAPPGASLRGGCAACPPGCPMHVKARPGCHHAGKVGCHQAAPMSGIRSACHGQDPANQEAPGLRGIMPAALALSPAILADRAEPASLPLAVRLLPEPPT